MCAVYTAAPVVTSPPVDKINPFKLPFEIKNDCWIPLYNVFPDCRIEWFDFGWMNGGQGEIAGIEVWADIWPGNTRHYACPYAIYEDYTALIVVLDVYYDIPIIPGLGFRHRRMTSHRFEAMESSGGHVWIEGYPLSGDLGHPEIPPQQRSPQFETMRELAKKGLLPPQSKPKGPHVPIGAMLGRTLEDIKRDRATESTTQP